MNEGKDFFSKKWVKFISFLLIIVFVLAAIPWGMQMLINQDSIAKGSDDGWLGFWGGYLGAIVGVFGTYCTVQIQLANEKKARKEEKTDNTFFNLLAMHNEQLSNLKQSDTFNQIYKDFKRALNVELRKAGYEYVKNKETLKKQLTEAKNQYEEYIKQNESKIPGEYKESYESCWKNKHSQLALSEVDSTTDNIMKAIGKILAVEDIINKVIEGKVVEGTELYEDIKILLNQTELNVDNALKDELESILQYKESNFTNLKNYRKANAFEEVFSRYYSDMGSYFRLFHRIIKYINENVADPEAKSNYLGFLRSTVNQEEMFVIFYNAAYTKRGLGLLFELHNTTFFGTKEDIENNQHFDKEDLFWIKDDTNIMVENGKSKAISE